MERPAQPSKSARTVIITCAVTGSVHTPSMTPHLPITPDDIARESVEAAEAGAAVIHLQARDPKDGRPTPDPDVFMRFLPRIKQNSDAVINITTGGSLGMSMEDAKARFGFLLDALKFGAPPHGGIALGLDRWAMMLAGTTNIRDVIAFPKNQKARDLMTGAPAPVEARQLKDLGLKQ